MSRATYSQSFYLETYKEGEDLTEYVRRNLLTFAEDYLRYRIIDYAQGFGQNLEPSATGSYTVVTQTEHRLTNILVKPQAGSGLYTYDINLSLDKKQHNREGDYIRIFFDSVASTNPTINVRNEAGTILFTKTYDGTGTDTQLTNFILSNNTWKN